jgi:hypothetical protein
MQANRASDKTLTSYGTERLLPLCAATGLGHNSNAISAMFQRLMGDSGQDSLDRRPRWPSTVGDDRTPYEFSVAYGPTPELRVMVEPLGDEASLSSHAAVSFALLRSLARDYPIDLSRLALLENLFMPERPSGTFAMWVAVSFGASNIPDFKIYLNPQAQGTAQAPAVIEEAMTRLGFRDSVPVVTSLLARRGPELDELKYVSLDLARGPTARFKVYARHHECTAAVLEAAARPSPYYQPGEISAYLETLAPGVDTYLTRSPFTCYAFTDRSTSGPASVTTHFPINGYAHDDRAVQARVMASLRQLRLSSSDYSATIAGYANRALETAVGLHTYVSLRRESYGPRLTVYLACEAYGAGRRGRHEVPSVDKDVVVPPSGRIDRTPNAPPVPTLNNNEVNQ